MFDFFPLELSSMSYVYIILYPFDFLFPTVHRIPCFKQTANHQGRHVEKTSPRPELPQHTSNGECWYLPIFQDGSTP